MKIPKTHHDVSSYALMGGEDLVTSAIEVKPGRLSYSQNYECNLNGRYRMIDGYEAFDGQSKPSDASYWILNYEGLTTGATFTSGNTLNQSVDGEEVATGLIIGQVAATSTTGYIVLTEITGTFQDEGIIYETSYSAEYITDSDNQNFTDGTINEWVVNVGGGTGVCEYEGADPAAEKVMEIRTTSAGVTYLYGTLPTANMTPIVTGDFIIVTAKFYLEAANTCDHLLLSFINMDKVGSSIGWDNQTKGEWIEKTALYQFSGVDFTGDFVAGFYGAPTNGDIVYIDDLSAKKVTNAAITSSVALEQGASTTALHDTYIQLAIETVRAFIATVPGSGNVIGVHQYEGVKYAFRNNAGGTACAMYKSSSAGWVLCDLGRSLPFTSGGVYVIAEDDVIAGELGVATATVKRVVITSGSLAGGDAAGVLILYSQVGDFEAETIRVGANANVATITGNSTENTLTASGRFEFENYNFYGHSDYFRMYGVDGVSKGFEWDGSTFVPISTGMTTDTPNHIAVHKKHLFFSFPGGSLQHSGTGTPYIWTPVTGASEIGIGDDITRLSVNAGILAIFSRNSTHLLYGTSIDDWELTDHSLESGCIEWSAQTLGTEVYLDDRGLTTLQTTDKYGDFVGNVISDAIQPYLKTMLGNVQSSIRVKDKGQYRLYFDNMEGICLTMNKNKVIGFTRFFYDKLPVCCSSAENSSGEEELYFGSTDGFVYQLDSGTSFNGEEMTNLLRFHYNHLKTPFNEKQLRQLILEGEFPIGTSISYYIDFSYGDDAESESVDFDVVEAGGIWGVADWDDFVWDGPTVGLARAYPEGSGINFALMISSTSTYVEPHTLNALSVHYSIRGLRR